MIKGIGYVFLGLLPPEELQDIVLKKELKIKKTDAENIFFALNKEIFLNLKNSLESLYGIKLKGRAFSKKNGKDTYREPIN